MTHFRSNRTYNYSVQQSYCSESNSFFTGTRKGKTFNIRFSIWYKVNLFLWLLCSKIITGTEQLGSQIVRRLFGHQCKNRCVVHILEAYLVPFTGHVGCQSVTKKQVAGKKGRTSSEAAEGCSPPSRAWAALPRRRSKENHPLHSLESSGHKEAGGSTTGREGSQAR